MEGESSYVLPPAKRLKTEEDEMLGETPAAAAAEEMSTESSDTDGDGVMWSSSENFVPYDYPEDRSPFDKMLDEYDYLDNELLEHGYKGFFGNPVKDKEYLFLFCKLMSVDENYRKVLADKDMIYSWTMKDISESDLPESLAIAKKIVDEHNLALNIKDMWCCLEDLLTDWLWRMKMRGIKEFEKFLLQFWEKNGREPTSAENIGFCHKWRCATSAKFGVNVPIVVTARDVREGQDIGWWLRKGTSTTQEIKKSIEVRYKQRLSEICVCQAHYIHLKLDKAEKSGLAKQIGELLPAFKKLEVPAMEMDPLRLDKDPRSLCLY